MALTLRAQISAPQTYVGTEATPAAARVAAGTLDPATVTLQTGDQYTNGTNVWVWNGTAWTLLTDASVWAGTGPANLLKGQGPDSLAGLYTRPVEHVTQTEYNGLGANLDNEVLYVITGP